jgi:MoaA/NifB/PqqE/SkfB family radical SAM enzyme
MIVQSASSQKPPNVDFGVFAANWHLAMSAHTHFPSTIEPYAARAARIDPAIFAQQLASSQAAGPRLILWDLVGSCNLRCPSCPVGTMHGTNPKGLISDEMFYRVLEKLAREFPKWQLHFYNWTEPLIHPHIVEYTRAAAKAGFHLHLSSNLNHLKDAQGIISAGAKTFRISLSGFTQAVYEQGHRGGNIETVKRNMRLLSEARKSTDARTRVHVYFHKYRHNLHELPQMEQFARSLGFDFMSDWAYLMPVEKLLAYIDDELPGHERQFADASIVPNVNNAIAAIQPHREHNCELIDQLVIDHQGNITLCCAVYDGIHNGIANYLESDWQQIQSAKYGHSTCDKCMHYGVHTLYTHFSKPQLREMMTALADRDLQDDPANHTSASIRLPLFPTHSLRASA